MTHAWCLRHSVILCYASRRKHKGCARMTQRHALRITAGHDAVPSTMLPNPSPSPSERRKMPDEALRGEMQTLREAVQELKEEIADLHSIAQALSHKMRRVEER